MPAAILVSGNERRFLQDSTRLRGYLKKWVGLERIASIRACYLNEEQLLRRIDMHMQNFAGHDPLLLAYSGHGLKDCWSLGSSNTISYENLSLWVGCFSAQVLILNHCCYSASIVPFYIRPVVF